MIKKTFIISDLHIADGSKIDNFENEKEFIDFLNYLKLEAKNKSINKIELIILGDLIDFWKVDGKNKLKKVISNNIKLFETFRENSKFIDFLYVPGNHDHEFMFNNKYRSLIQEYGIKVIPKQFFKRKYGNKNLIGEHGNQVEAVNKFIKFEDPPTSSLSYHICDLVLFPFMRLGTANKTFKWIKSMDNLDVSLLPWWIMSKYFYYELGPMLQAIVTPLLILFSFAVPYVIFDVITKFWHPKFILTITNFIDSNVIARNIAFILYLDLVVVFILMLVWLIKREVYKKLRKCGIQSFSEVVLTLKNEYTKHAKKVLNGANSFNKKFDIYVCGHTHRPLLDKLYINRNKYHIDTGCFRQTYKRVPSKFRFPSVFVEHFELSFVEIEYDNVENFLKIALKNWPKPKKPKLKFLERIAVYGRRIPKQITKLQTVKEVKIPTR